MSLWKAGQSFFAKIDYFFKVDHISKKMTRAFFDIRPTTHLVCTLLAIGQDGAPGVIDSVTYPELYQTYPKAQALST